MADQHAWDKWSNHVLSELKRLDTHSIKISNDIEILDERIQSRFLELHVVVAELKTRSTLWGAIAGTVFGALVAGGIDLLVKK